MCRRDFENTPKTINKIKGIRGPKWGFLTLIKEVFEMAKPFFLLSTVVYIVHINGKPRWQYRGTEIQAFGQYQ